MEERKDITQAKALIPLLRSITREMRERGDALNRFETLRSQLLRSANVTNEGFLAALQDVDACIAAERRGIEAAQKECDRLAVQVLSLRPLVVHIPGRTSRGDVVFSWEEGEELVDRRDAEKEGAEPMGNSNPS